MENIEKVYTPTVIQESPFPSSIKEDLSTDDSKSQGSYKPTTIEDKPFPQKRIATELISRSLDTKSRKIQQEYEFTESGAIQIGKYQQDQSGEVKVSPEGIVAKNKKGETTFALDGDNGDAIFAGQVRAGATIVSDSIITEKSTNGNGRTVYYNDGLPAIVIGDPS